MTATAHDQLVAAFENGDQLGVRRLGWWTIWEAAATWWAPRQTATAKDMVPFAKLLGDEDPAKVLDALRDLAGDWRPTPAQVRGHLHRNDHAEHTVNAGRATDPARDPAALTAALAAGEHVCECGDPAGRTWRRDQHGVWRCPDCGGIEQGQAWAAEDAHAATVIEQSA
jgi:ribosomal protein L37AE/L43A